MKVPHWRVRRLRHRQHAAILCCSPRLLLPSHQQRQRSRRRELLHVRRLPVRHRRHDRLRTHNTTLAASGPSLLRSSSSGQAWQSAASPRQLSHRPPSTTQGTVPQDRQPARSGRLVPPLQQCCLPSSACPVSRRLWEICDDWSDIRGSCTRWWGTHGAPVAPAARSGEGIPQAAGRRLSTIALTSSALGACEAPHSQQPERPAVQRRTRGQSQSKRLCHGSQAAASRDGVAPWRPAIAVGFRPAAAARPACTRTMLPCSRAACTADAWATP